MKTTSDRLKEIMNERSLSQADILNSAKKFYDELGVSLSKADMSHYVNGKHLPTQDKLTLLSKVLGVSEPWLMGYNVPRTDVTEEVSYKPIPIVGTIAAGTPILATENIEDYVHVDPSLNADYGLIVKGDSMVNACIQDGDIAFIRKQPTLENGEIGAVLIDQEATLKRFKKTNGTVVLLPENASYDPIVLTGGDVHILGKLIGIYSDRDK